MLGLFRTEATKYRICIHEAKEKWSGLKYRMIYEKEYRDLPQAQLYFNGARPKEAQIVTLEEITYRHSEGQGSKFMPDSGKLLDAKATPPMPKAEELLLLSGRYTVSVVNDETIMKRV